MIDINQIKAFSQKIVEKFQPDRIILFGSYAYGQPNEDSDVDLLVILPFEEMPVKTAIAIRQQIKSPFPLDLIARTPDQIQQRLDMGDFFIKILLIEVMFFMKQITQEWIDKAEGGFVYLSSQSTQFSNNPISQ